MTTKVTAGRTASHAHGAKDYHSTSGSEFSDAVSRLAEMIKLQQAGVTAGSLREDPRAGRPYFEVHRLAVYLEFHDPIVPGQALEFTWSVSTLLNLPLNLGIRGRRQMRRIPASSQRFDQ